MYSTGSEPEWATIPQRLLETIIEEDHPDGSVGSEGSALTSVLTAMRRKSLNKHLPSKKRPPIGQNLK